MTDFDVDYFIAKFEAIPEDKWCIGVHADEHGRHCAAGHCGEHEDAGTDESRALCKLVPYDFATDTGGIAQLNDGQNPDYQQPTPKQRILAALRDIKAGQNGSVAS